MVGAQCVLSAISLPMVDIEASITAEMMTPAFFAEAAYHRASNVRHVAGLEWKDSLMARKSKEKTERLSIAQLEELLEQDDERSIRILPNGEITYDEGGTGTPKPLTMREQLGGEYAI